MTRWSKLTGIFSSLFLAMLCSCSSSDKEPSVEDNGKDRQEILTHWADNIIIPAYAEFKIRFDAMLERSNAFTATPDEATLLAFRNSWVDAYQAWQRVELFEFGPADKYTLRSFFNIYPADVEGIALAINDPAMNLDVPASYARQGFPALDYLLNGTGANDTGIVAFYSTGPDASKRLAYITRITGRMAALITNVVNEWSTYRETFVAKTGLDINSSTGLVVNAYVLHYERFIRTGKIGIPSGATLASAGVLHPEKVEAYYKGDLSQTLVKLAHQAAVDFFNGKSVTSGEDGPSFRTYLDALEAKDAGSGTLLSTLINDQFSLVHGKLDLLLPSLYEQVQTDNQAMVDIHTDMQKAVRMLKVDMTSNMSITITYTDNDGD